MPCSLRRCALGAGSSTTFPPALKGSSTEIAIRHVEQGGLGGHNSFHPATHPKPIHHSARRVCGKETAQRPGLRGGGAETPPRRPAAAPARPAGASPPQPSPRPPPARAPAGWRLEPRAARAPLTVRPGPAPELRGCPGRPLRSRPGPALSGAAGGSRRPARGPRASSGSQEPGPRAGAPRKAAAAPPRAPTPQAAPGPGGSRLSGRVGPPPADGPPARLPDRQGGGRTAPKAPLRLSAPGWSPHSTIPAHLLPPPPPSAPLPERRSPATAPPPLPHSPRPSTHSGSDRPAPALESKPDIR